MTLTEPKIALAGVGLESSFTRFETSMIAFSTEMVLSGRSGRWDFGSLVVERQKSWRTGCANGPELRSSGRFVTRRLVETQPFDGGDRILSPTHLSKV